MKRFIYLVIITLFLCNCSLGFAQEYTLISNIYIIGNHKTKKETITRELSLSIGQIIANEEFEKEKKFSESNLVRTSLFNIVSIKHVDVRDNTLSNYIERDIIIEVVERWYYWPIIGINLEDRNFSNWIKNPSTDKVTFEIGGTIFNIAGRNQKLTAVNSFGYNKGLKFEYDNIILDKNGKNFMDISLNRYYSRSINLNTQNNEVFFLKSDSSYLTDSYCASISYYYRQKLRMLHQITFQFEYKEIDQSVLEKNPNFWGGEELRRRSLSLSYSLTLDYRDNKQYANKGYYCQFSILGYTNHDASVKYASLKSEIQIHRMYNTNWGSSFNLKMGLSFKNNKGYIFDRAIGYDNILLRGYEYFVADGQHYTTFSHSLKYSILPNHLFKLGFLPFAPRFNSGFLSIYGRYFTDFGYAYHSYQPSNNSLSNRLLVSTGIGLDLVTYYDITLALDFSLNHMGKTGLFFSFKSPLR